MARPLPPLFAALPAIVLIAATQPQAPTAFEVVWNVEPTKLDTPASISTKVSKQIASTRLLPSRLFVLDEDAVSSTRGLIAVQDSELAVAETNSRGVAACVIDARKVKRRTGRSGRANRNNTCLLDTDLDGRFDHFFVYASASFSLGAVGKVRGLEPIGPTSYLEAPAAGSRDSWHVTVRAWPRRSEVQFDLCPDANPGSLNSDCFAPSIAVGNVELPRDVTIAGAVFHVQRQPDGSALIEQRSGFSMQPVHVRNWLSR